MLKKASAVLFFGFLLISFYFSFSKKQKEIFINESKFQTEVVWKDEDLHKGLGQRSEICQNCAMLFDFAKPGKYSFWMKDMRFPLDILWIKNKKIVYIEKNIDKNSKEIYNPDVEADQVLEINGGLSDNFGIKIGDNLR